jgi:hypothetical protein
VKRDRHPEDFLRQRFLRKAVTQSFSKEGTRCCPSAVLQRVQYVLQRPQLQKQQGDGKCVNGRSAAERGERPLIDLVGAGNGSQ